MGEKVAPRAGFEPATNRLTAGCSTAELPGKSLLARRQPAYNKAEPALESPPRRATSGTLRAQGGRKLARRLEATPGIEPGYAVLCPTRPPRWRRSRTPFAGSPQPRAWGSIPRAEEPHDGTGERGRRVVRGLPLAHGRSQSRSRRRRTRNSVRQSRTN